MASPSRFVFPFFAMVSVFVLEGCGGASLAQPFDQMRNAPITVFRLQNYEPPQQPQAAAQAPTTLPFQLPPQIMDWAQQAASLLPPGLLPPGILPGAPAPQAAQPNVQRFHGFPILGWMAVNDSKVHDDVLDVLGHDSNFVAKHDNCLYAEFGFSIAAVNAPASDVLVSLSCDQVQAQGFAWPYANTGIPASTAQRIAAVVQRVFGGA